MSEDPGLKGASWVKVNKDQTGFYRTLYSDALYERLGVQLATNRSVPLPYSTSLVSLPSQGAMVNQALSATDRAGLIYDAFSAAKAGMLEMPTVLGLLTSAADEEERAPLNIIHGQLDGIARLLYHTDEYVTLQVPPPSSLCLPPLGQGEVGLEAYQRHLLEPIYNKLGWSVPAEHPAKLRQLDVLSDACRLRHPDCVKQAKALFAQWQKDPLQSAPSLLLIIEKGLKGRSGTGWPWTCAPWWCTRGCGRAGGTSGRPSTRPTRPAAIPPSATTSSPPLDTPGTPGSSTGPTLIMRPWKVEAKVLQDPAHDAGAG